MDNEIEMLKQRIQNLEFAVVELISHIEIGDSASNTSVVEYARSVLEGEFEE